MQMTDSDFTLHDWRRRRSLACGCAHACVVRTMNNAVLQLAGWLCGLDIFRSADRPCNDRACLYSVYHVRVWFIFDWKAISCSEWNV